MKSSVWHDRQLFAQPRRAISPSADSFAEELSNARELINARHVNVSCLLDQALRVRCRDLLDFGDHCDGVWKQLAHACLTFRMLKVQFVGNFGGALALAGQESWGASLSTSRSVSCSQAFMSFLALR
jgi:hypothetical protein